MKNTKLTEAAERILKIYIALVEKNSHYPSRVALMKAKVSRDQLRDHFGTMEELRVHAKEYSPKSFEDIVDESLFTPKRFRELKKEAGNFNRYFVSCVVTECKVHENFFKSIANHNKRRDALSLYLTATDPASRGSMERFDTSKMTFDPILSDSHIVFDDLALNDNIFLSSIKLSAKHVDPTTGLSRIGQRNGSFIYASPKQRLKMTPTSNIKIPHAMMTTGAVTLPNYDSAKYMSGRTAYIADNDHVVGGIIVEIADDRIFHYRQVQSDELGSFIDLGKRYTPDGKVTTVRPEALDLGDWHSGETDPVARQCFLSNPDSVLNVTKPKKIIVHDGFNGKSISHHEIKNIIVRAQHAKLNLLSLQDELEAYAKDLEFMASFDFVEEVVIVMSNHDEFLHRYLADSRYSEDPQNHLLSLKLAVEQVEGRNPIKSAVEWFGIKNAHKLRWLARDEDYKIANIEVGAHGDKGANGARGSLRAMENAYGNSVSGHAHTPEILRGAWQNGTCSKLKLEYNKGPSSWMHTSCLIYPNGMRQLINVINGSWRI